MKTAPIAISVALGFAVVVVDTMWLAKAHQPAPQHGEMSQPLAYSAQPST